MRRNRSENPRLGMFGVINADMWAKMDEKTQRKWIVKHANLTLPKLVHMDLKKEPSAELGKVYDVTARYTLLDSFYNQRGEVMFELQWSRAARAKIVDYEQEV